MFEHLKAARDAAYIFSSGKTILESLDIRIKLEGGVGIPAPTFKGVETAGQIMAVRQMQEAVAKQRLVDGAETFLRENPPA